MQSCGMAYTFTGAALDTTTAHTASVLWTLKKEAGLLFQKDRKRPQEVGKKIETPFRLVMMCLQVTHA